MKKSLSLICLLLAMMIPAAALACEHNYGPWRTKTSATCTRQGHQFKYCLKCDHWEQRYTSKLPHTPGEKTVTKEPTCTETGREEAICQVCNNKVRYTIDKLPHKDGEMVVTKEPTCTESGTGEYTCADCGRKRRETIKKLGHDLGEMVVTKEPTCTATGTGEEACKRCSYVRKSKLEKTEHPFGEWTVTREPQGKRKGVRVSICTVCGRERQENFFHEGTLYEGMKANEAVIRMQEKLRDLGFYKGAIRSGQFGDLTTSAVARFQQSVGMEGSGVADQQTLDALKAAWEQATGKTESLAPEVMEAAEQAQTIAE